MNAAEERKREWADFEAALKRPVAERLRRGCIHTFKPGLDEGPGIRMWNTMEEYRHWCEKNLPRWLGYHRVTEGEWERRIETAMKGTPCKGSSKGRHVAPKRSVKDYRRDIMQPRKGGSNGA